MKVRKRIRPAGILPGDPTGIVVLVFPVYSKNCFFKHRKLSKIVLRIDNPAI
jgi:hypothetical protein